MSYAVANLLLTIINIYWWVVIVMAVMSWLIAFNVVNMRAPAAFGVWRAVNALTEPLLRPIRTVLPPLGGMDLSPIVLLLALQFLSDLIVKGAGGLALG